MSEKNQLPEKFEAEKVEKKDERSTKDQGQPRRKIGDQALKASASLGLEELRNALYPESNVAQQATEPGMWGDRSFGDLAHDRAQLNESTTVSDYVRQAEASREQAPSDRDGPSR